jgi:hypothetical protein
MTLRIWLNIENIYVSRVATDQKKKKKKTIWILKERLELKFVNYW